MVTPGWDCWILDLEGFSVNALSLGCQALGAKPWALIFGPN